MYIYIYSPKHWFMIGYCGYWPLSRWDAHQKISETGQVWHFKAQLRPFRFVGLPRRVESFSSQQFDIFQL
jgi:hypothetical protein